MLGAYAMAAKFRLDELLAGAEPPMSQSELARISGVSLVTINAIAKNRTAQVKLETLDKILGALERAGVPATFNDLLERESGGKRRGRG